MTHPVYSADIFNIRDEKEAREIILTREGHISSEERWVKETPWTLDLARKWLDLSGRVLDFGAGIGRLTVPLAESLSKPVWAMDTSPMMRRLLARNHNVLTIGQDTLDDWELDGVRPCDAVLAVWVLQHVHDPGRTLRQLRALMKPHARMLVVNNLVRAVPTANGKWVNDGFDVRDALRCMFRTVAEGAVDLWPLFAAHTFWGVYEKPDTSCPSASSNTPATPESGPASGEG